MTDRIVDVFPEFEKPLRKHFSQKGCVLINLDDETGLVVEAGEGRFYCRRISIKEMPSGENRVYLTDVVMCECLQGREECDRLTESFIKAYTKK